MSIKEKSELEFVTATRMEVPTLTREEGRSPADDRLPFHTGTAPPVAAPSPLPAPPALCKQMWASIALAASGVETQGGRNRRRYVLPHLTGCLKPRSAHRRVLRWSAEVPQQSGSQESSVPCGAALLPPLKITHEYKKVSWSKLVRVKTEKNPKPLHLFEGHK